MTLASSHFDTISMAELNLRAACRRACEKHPNLPRIRTIASVGAFDNRLGHSTRDASRLTHSLEYLLKSGFLVDPEFSVDAVNFMDNRDFIREDTQADLIFVSYIIRHSTERTAVFRRAAEGAPRPAIKDLTCMLSRYHDEHRWTERARRAGAKMIVAYGGSIEIGAEYFCEPTYSAEPFQLLIASPQEECSGSFQIDEMKRIYGTRLIDLPVAGLSFSADQQYLHAAAPAMTQETYLSKICRDVPDFGLKL